MDVHQRLLQINLKLLEQFSGSTKDHHILQCLICNHSWSATPLSKFQAFKKHQSNGCPQCHNTKKEQKNQQTLQLKIDSIEQMGYQILNLNNISKSYDWSKRVRVKRIECGHEWDTVLSSLANGNIICKICNNIRKRELFQQRNQHKHMLFLQTATEWQKYNSEVRILTNLNYKRHSKIINPLNLTRGVAGQPGKHQLDHTLTETIRFC